jgi:hypothetical protein
MSILKSVTVTLLLASSATRMKFCAVPELGIKPRQPAAMTSEGLGVDQALSCTARFPSARMATQRAPQADLARSTR